MFSPDAPVTRTGRRRSGVLKPLSLLVLSSLFAAAWVQGPDRGPGDPTTVLATGLSRPCRMAFDEHGDLFVAEIVTREVRRVTPDGTVTLFNSGLGDYRGITFDAFGDILLSDRVADVVHRISPQGTVTTFAAVQDPSSAATVAPDGDVWIPAGDSLHHFTPLGDLVESIDIGAQGASGAGLTFSPSGAMYLANWGSVWLLQNGAVTSVQTGMTLRNWGFTFDLAGNVVRAREAMEAGDTDRIILWDGTGNAVDDSLVTQVVDPCGVVFARDASGATTNQLVIAQQNGEILRANAAGISSAGLPLPPMAIRDISTDDQMATLAGHGGVLTPNHAHFLDAIGNRNGSYDVGDFRAFLMATGAVPNSSPGLEGAAALAFLSGIRNQGREP